MKKIKLNKRDIEGILKYLNTIHPDYDGYVSREFIDERIMKLYRKKYPHDWDRFGCPKRKLELV